MSTRVPHWSLCWVKQIQFTHPHHIPLKIKWMFPSYTRLGPLCCIFLKLANEIPAHFSLLSRIWCMPRPNLILLLITVIIFGEECNNEVLVYSVFSSLVLLLFQYAQSPSHHRVLWTLLVCLLPSLWLDEFHMHTNYQAGCSFSLLILTFYGEKNAEFSEPCVTNNFTTSMYS